MGYIYKISTDFNDKVYIGQTSRTILIRFEEHITKPNKNSYIDNSIKTHGRHHYKVEEVEEVENNDFLDEREIYWINFYNSYHKGYNLTPGGGGNRFSSQEIQQIYDLWDNGLGVKEIGNKLDFSRSAIRKVLKEYQNYSQEESNKRQIENHYKQIDIYDLNNNFLYTEKSQLDFCNKNNISTGALTNALKNRHNVLNKFRILYHGEDPKILQSFADGKRFINQYDLNDNLIASFESAAKAGQALGIDRKQIMKAIKGERKNYKNYIWKYGDLI